MGIVRAPLSGIPQVAADTVRFRRPPDRRPCRCLASRRVMFDRGVRVQPNPHGKDRGRVSLLRTLGRIEWLCGEVPRSLQRRADDDERRGDPDDRPTRAAGLPKVTLDGRTRSVGSLSMGTRGGLDFRSGWLPVGGVTLRGVVVASWIRWHAALARWSGPPRLSYQAGCCAAPVPSSGSSERRVKPVAPLFPRLAPSRFGTRTATGCSR